jgi:hypothetical protein
MWAVVSALIPRNETTEPPLCPQMTNTRHCFFFDLNVSKTFLVYVTKQRFVFAAKLDSRNSVRDNALAKYIFTVSTTTIISKALSDYRKIRGPEFLRN